MSIRARVSGGRIIVDEPTLLHLDDDGGGDLDDEELEALNAHLAAGWKSAQAGRLRPASELLAKLRSKLR